MTTTVAGLNDDDSAAAFIEKLGAAWFVEGLVFTGVRVLTRPGSPGTRAGWFTEESEG
jgi:hypothetical protein